MKRFLAIITAVALAVALTPALAFAGDLAMGNAMASRQSTVVTVQKSKKQATVKKARKAYKKYLAQHRSIKYFKVVKMGNGGIPVLLCSKRPMFTNVPYHITTDVVIYDKSQKSKVKNIGTVGTGGTAYGLNYAKGALYGYRIADMHTFTVVKVKNGHLSMSGMYDNLYGPNLKWRHFSNYNPKTMGTLWQSKALGKMGTQSQYYKLGKKYGSHLYKPYKNTKENRKKHI